MARCILLLSLFLPLAATAQPSKCPAKFEEFLSRFETDMKFQVANVRFPLQIAFWDDGVKIKDRLNKMQYTRPRQPWFPTPALQSDWQLKKTIRNVSATRKLVHFQQDDAEGYRVDFHFQRAGGCWRLVFMEDYSS